MQVLRCNEELQITKLPHTMRRMEEIEAGKTACAEIQKEIDLIKADTKKIQDQNK